MDPLEQKSKKGGKKASGEAPKAADRYMMFQQTPEKIWPFGKGKKQQMERIFATEFDGIHYHSIVI